MQESRAAECNEKMTQQLEKAQSVIKLDNVPKYSLLSLFTRSTGEQSNWR